MLVKPFLSGLSCGSIRGRRRFCRQRELSLGVSTAQTLEVRRVLTGNVVATFNVASGLLTFTGDAANNGLTISVDGTGDAIATGNSGTTINGMASLNISDFTGDILSSVVVNAGDGADVINLSTAVNTIFFPGPVTINGNNGNDTVNVGTAGGQSVSFGSLTITGGNDNDLISFKSSLFVPAVVVLQGNSGNDTYSFDTDIALGFALIQESAGGGNDTLNFTTTTTRAVAVNLSSAAAQAVNPALTLTLSAGNTLENVIGGSLGDTLTGNSLANKLTGNNGNDTLNGGGGKDFFYGGGGNDTMTGGPGDDTYVFDTDAALGIDTINEAGGGVDTLDFRATTTRAITVSLANGAAQNVNAGLTLTLSAGDTMENVVGGSLGDTLTGNALANSLSGGDGNDSLSGGNGRDILVGGRGMDNLLGGSGEDLLIAGRTVFASEVSALVALRSEWVRTDISYADRMAHLVGTLAGGNNGTTVLTSTTVKEDAAKDTLSGGTSRDWYFRNSLGAVAAQRDTVTDADLDSVFTEISTWL